MLERSPLLLPSLRPLLPYIKSQVRVDISALATSIALGFPSSFPSLGVPYTPDSRFSKSDFVKPPYQQSRTTKFLCSFFFYDNSLCADTYGTTVSFPSFRLDASNRSWSSIHPAHLSFHHPDQHRQTTIDTRDILGTENNSPKLILDQHLASIHHAPDVTSLALIQGLRPFGRHPVLQ